MSFFDSSLTDGAITRNIQKRIPDFFADLEEVSREICAPKTKEEAEPASLSVSHPANENIFQTGLELVSDSLADIETPLKDTEYVQQPLLNVVEAPSEKEIVPADPGIKEVNSVEAFFGGIYGISGSHIPVSRKKHAFVAAQAPYFDSDLGMRLGLVYEVFEKIPAGGLYETIKEGVKETLEAAAYKDGYPKGCEKYADEGFGIIKRAAKKLDRKKLPKADSLDPADYAKEDSDGRMVVSGRYLEAFKDALEADLARYRGLGVSKDVIKHLEAMSIELVLGTRHAAHFDAKKNKAVFHLSFDRLASGERKRLASEGLTDKEIKNIEILCNAYGNSRMRHAALQRAASNSHVRNDLVNMQADTFLGDLTEGLSMYLAFEGILESGALKTLSAKDRKNLWKTSFSKDLPLRQIDAGCYRQFLKVGEWLNPKTGGKKKKPGKEELELSKLPKHLQRMVKGRMYLSSDELIPYSSVKEVKESRERFRLLRSKMSNKTTTKEKALMYPEATIVKLLVTLVTAPKDDGQSGVVKESYSLLGDIVQAFDTNKKGKISDGFVYNTYKNILPKVCGG